MLSVEEALAIVANNLPPRRSEPCTLLQGIGFVLAEDVKADADVPPFNRSMMDGYAVIASLPAKAPQRLTVAGTVHAGSTPTTAVTSDTAVKIMTGAPLPQGADAVVRKEDTREIEGGAAVDILVPVKQWKNVVRQGEEMKAGEVVLNAGTTLRAQEIGVLATVGKERIRICGRPTVAIVATGSELVEIGKKPGPGQIRNSNSYSLAAQCLDTGASFAYLGIAGDDPQSLAQKVVSGLSADVLLLSGGVSVGDRDIVPEVLAGAGVEILFHKVAMKPGRPLLFGKKGACLVFGLPGNPVSAFVGFEVFVRPVLAHLVGNPAIARASVSLPLADDIDVKTDRTWFAPARIDIDAGGNGTVALVQSRGSADIPALSRGNAFAVFPGATATYRKGSMVRTILLGDVMLGSSTHCGR